jgi:nitrogen-specific signal transduction histidine kinase/ActR/RegA family two-component response regulator
MGTCTDIHEQKTTFDALTASESALRDAHRRKDEFLAMLAHELRNPLAPIRTAAQLIDLPNATLPQARKAGQVIARQVKHMAELVDDLLDVSRVTRGQIVLERQVFDIREAVRSAIEQARPLVEARAHALRTRLPSKPTFVDGDRTRLVQVIANLLNNAAKYTPPGGEVSVDARVDDAGVTVTVADTGVGIEPDLLPHVFELFTQGKRTLDRSQGGLGIGLALVKGLVDLHGGRVLASSEGSGTGSRFSVWIPTVAPDAQAAKETSASARLEAVPRRVIVVDDNQDAAQTLALLLESHGHTVSVYYSAEDALAEAPARPADTYLLDIGLPGMSGLELARELRTLHAGARVHLIALSGYGRPQDLEASRDAGFDDHLTKPVDGERLIAVMTSGVGTTSDTTPGN